MGERKAAPAYPSSPVDNILFGSLKKATDENLRALLPPAFLAVRDKGEKAVTLVMSGGGAYAPFHIGMAGALRERGIPYDLIIGTSAGSIGAAVAARSNTLQAYLHGKHLGETVNWNQLTSRTRGKMVFDLMIGYMDDHGREMEELSVEPPLPVVINTYNRNKIGNGLTVHFNPPPGETWGKLIAASTSIPLVIEPQSILEDVHVDGGTAYREGSEPVGVARTIAPDALVVSVQINTENLWTRPRSQADIRISPNWKSLERSEKGLLKFDPVDVYNGYLVGLDVIPEILKKMEERNIEKVFKPGFFPGCLLPYFRSSERNQSLL